MQVGISNNVGFSGFRFTQRSPKGSHSAPPINVGGVLFRDEADLNSTIAQGIQEAAAKRAAGAAKPEAAKPKTTTTAGKK